MAGPEDFDRLGELLGDACDAAASPAAPRSARGPRPTSPADTPRGETRADRDHRSERDPGDAGDRTGTTRTTDAARALALAWPEVVGAEVAANATPVQLKNGRLTVSTSSSVWAQTLQYMSADLTTRLNERLGSEAIRETIFRHAGWEERPRNVTRGQPETDQTFERSRLSDGAAGQAVPDQGVGVTDAGLSAEQKQALAGVEQLELPPEIKEKVIRAMQASFVRAQRGLVR